MLSFVAGNVDALRDLNSSKFNTTLRLNDEMTEAVLFRFFENGVLYRRAADRKIVYSTWDRISEIAGENTQPRQQVRVCDFFGLCVPQKTSPAVK
jgi:hypothetical protein